MDFGRTLIIVPHRDDEVLGLGGTLDPGILKPSDVQLLYFNTTHPAVPQDQYDTEAQNLLDFLNYKAAYFPFGKVNRLDQTPIADLITFIEQWINYIEPDTVFVPFPSYNQDHRHLFEATVTATRPHDTNHYVRNLLVYEQPETIQTFRVGAQFVPNLFVPIDIDYKLRLYNFYPSQHRGHRTHEHLRALARTRGMQCNAEYAEAFMALRLTNDYR